MTKIKNTNDILSWRGFRVRGTFLHCRWEYKLKQPLWNSVWLFFFFLKVRNQSNLRHSNTTLRHITKGCTFISQGCLLFLFIIFSIGKQPRCSSKEEWIKKIWYIYTMVYYTVVKKTYILKFACKWIEQEKNILSEKSPTLKDKHGMYSLISGY